MRVSEMINALTEVDLQYHALAVEKAKNRLGGEIDLPNVLRAFDECRRELAAHLATGEVPTDCVLWIPDLWHFCSSGDVPAWPKGDASEVLDAWHWAHKVACEVLTRSGSEMRHGWHGAIYVPEGSEYEAVLNISKS